MATQAFYDWANAGRHFTVCIPIAYLVRRARLHGVSVLGTIGNEDHLRSNNPQDHTPFSVTAWPRPLIGYVVTACDIADGPWVDRLIADAITGRAPWIKYINARGLQWNVKNGWIPVRNSDQHCHVSARTDQLAWADSSWDPFTPNSSGEAIDVNEDQNRRLYNAEEAFIGPTLRMERDVSYVEWGKSPNGEERKTVPNALVRTITEIRDDVAELVGHTPTPVVVDGTSVANALIDHPVFMSRLAEQLAANLAERLKN